MPAARHDQPEGMLIAAADSARWSRAAAVLAAPAAALAQAGTVTSSGSEIVVDLSGSAAADTVTVLQNSANAETATDVVLKTTAAPGSGCSAYPSGGVVCPAPGSPSAGLIIVRTGAGDDVITGRAPRRVAGDTGPVAVRHPLPCALRGRRRRRRADRWARRALRRAAGRRRRRHADRRERRRHAQRRSRPRPPLRRPGRRHPDRRRWHRPGELGGGDRADQGDAGRQGRRRADRDRQRRRRHRGRRRRLGQRRADRQRACQRAAGWAGHRHARRRRRL